MKRHITRRSMLAQSACLAVGVHGLAPLRAATSANDKLHIACVGVGGKGWSDMLETSVGQHVVAICDVDETALARAAEKFPQARKYTDWRRLLDQNDVEAVTVSTPDHMHAPVAMSAMQLGRHVYCQKPLTHSVHEARCLTQAAQQSGVVTQMGIQHRSGTPFRTTSKLVRTGVIGRVSAVHVWTDRPIWPQGIARPTASATPPAHLHWDLWLGVAPQRPFVPEAYHRFKWRGFWDFGTGALGDMGCHGLDPVYGSLQLTAPLAVAAESPAPNDETAPPHSVVHFRFPATMYTSESPEVHWYDGVTGPPDGLLADSQFGSWKNGMLLVGEHGQILVDYDQLPRLLPEEKFRDVVIERESSENHYLQWTEACKGRGATCAPFSYAGPLTEFVLLGNVAIRAGQPLEWDAAALRAKGCPAAEPYLRRAYRSGWEVAGIS